MCVSFSFSSSSSSSSSSFSSPPLPPSLPFPGEMGGRRDGRQWEGREEEMEKGREGDEDGVQMWRERGEIRGD